MGIILDGMFVSFWFSCSTDSSSSHCRQLLLEKYHNIVKNSNIENDYRPLFIISVENIGMLAYGNLPSKQNLLEMCLRKMYSINFSCDNFYIYYLFYNDYRINDNYALIM